MSQTGHSRRRLSLDCDNPQRFAAISLSSSLPPEVILLLVQYLGLKARASCARVSRTWHRAFLPWIYDHVHISLRNEDVIPSVQILEKYAQLIGGLSFESGSEVVDSACLRLYCPHLASLDIQPLVIPGQDNGCLFLQRHQNTLLKVSYRRKVTADIIDSLAECPRLRRLELSQVQLAGPRDWMYFYDRVWSRLTVLVLSTTVTIGNVGEPFERISGRGTATIQDLTFDTSYRDGPATAAAVAYLWLLEHCPRLVRLHWHCSTGQVSVRHLIAALNVANCWEYLEAMALIYFAIDQSDLSDLLDQMVRLTELKLRHASFDQGAWEVIKRFPRHLQTLRVLNLFGCEKLPSLAIQDIMATLWGLEVFKAHKTTDEAMEQDGDRPWVCLGLKELQLQFDLLIPWPSTRILDRISNLMELEYCHFDIKFPRFNIKEKRDFALSLDKGMGTLRTLRKLKKLNVRGEWGEPDAWWVLQAWPELEEVTNVQVEERAQWLLHKVNFTPPKEL